MNMVGSMIGHLSKKGMCKNMSWPEIGSKRQEISVTKFYNKTPIFLQLH